jgi:hypothetical protein
MKDSTKRNLLTIPAVVIVIAAAYYTTELILSIARSSGTIVMWKDYITICMLPLIIYSFIMLLIYARILNILGWDKEYQKLKP